MGTLNFTVTGYGRYSERQLMSSDQVTSGAFTTSTSASFVEDAAGDIVAKGGQIFDATASEDMWVRFGGSAAAVGTGFFFPAGVPRQVEVARSHDEAKVSAIDVA